MISILRMGEDSEHDKEFDVNRPNGFPEYLFLLTKTRGCFFVNGAWKEFPAGCVVIFLPGQAQRYHASQSEKIYCDSWMHFESDTPILYNSFPFGEPIPLGESKAIEFNSIFHIICLKFYGMSPNRENILAHLVETLLLMANDENDSAKNMPEIYNRLVELRCEIYASPSIQWRVPEMASRLHISAGYLHALWKNFFATSCIADVVSARVAKAQSILFSSMIPISNVAERCGYTNTEHFIRQFKDIVKMTPAKWREKFIGQKS